MSRAYRVQHNRQTYAGTQLIQNQIVRADSAQEALFIASKGTLTYENFAFLSRETAVVRRDTTQDSKDIWIAEVEDTRTEMQSLNSATNWTNELEYRNQLE